MERYLDQRNDEASGLRVDASDGSWLPHHLRQDFDLNNQNFLGSPEMGLKVLP